MRPYRGALMLLLAACSGSAVRGGPAVASRTPTAPVLRSSGSFHPTYPSALRTVGVQGTVIATLAVTADGRVDTAASTIDSVTNRAFGAGLMPQLAGLRFKPARAGHRAIPGRLRVKFDYAIQPRCKTPTNVPTVDWQATAQPPTVRITTCRVSHVFIKSVAKAEEKRRTLRSPSPTQDSVATLLGLMPLFTPRPARDSLEIRIWIEGGLALPNSFVRLVRTGHRTIGFYAGYWPRTNQYARREDKTTSEKMHEYQAQRCDTFEVLGDLEGCWIHFTREPDWNRVWDSLTKLGVATLRDQIMVPHPPSYGLIQRNDGSDMVVEVRNGSRYRWYKYSSSPDTDADNRRALLIIGALGKVWDAR